MKRSLFAGAALIAAAMLPAGANAQDTIKIGVISAYSGQFADTAAQIDNGIKLYMKQHRDTLAGKKNENIRKDTSRPKPHRCTPAPQGAGPPRHAGNRPGC